MLKSKNSLGTLAAIAALAVTHSADANIKLVNFSNLAFPSDGNTLNIDIDDNGVDDFTIDNIINSSVIDIFGTIAANGIVSNGFTARPLGAGADVWRGQGYENSVSFSDFLPDLDGYIGLQFDRAGEKHYGWLELDFTAGAGTILRGAWEDISFTTNNDTLIKTGAVPEPSSSALIGGLVALIGVIGCQRRRKNT